MHAVLRNSLARLTSTATPQGVESGRCDRGSMVCKELLILPDARGSRCAAFVVPECSQTKQCCACCGTAKGCPTSLCAGCSLCIGCDKVNM